jgi:RNA recognition motif-containing protein
MAKVYIGHLPQDITDQELGDIFRTYGQINKLDLKIGFAFVEYQNAQDAEDAIRDLNGREIKGSAITIQVAKGPKENKTRIPKVARPDLV